MARTSLTHPLQIDSVLVPLTGGLIGMSICPGIVQGGPSERAWDRNLDLDLAAIKAWGASALVTLIDDYELEILSVADLPQKARAIGLEWHQLPIMNRDAPYEAFEEKWITSGRILRQHLRRGERIVLHCVYGLGRSGMVAARLLAELGESPDSAISRVRTARRGAIETEIQEQHVLHCRPAE